MLDIGASYSTLSTTELLENLLPQYYVENLISCEFWHRGINDTYKVTTKDFGRSWLDDSYIDRRIKFLKTIKEEHFT